MPKGTDDQVGFFVPQSKHIYEVSSAQDEMSLRGYAHTLFAGLDLSFSKIFWDCALVALMANAL